MGSSKKSKDKDREKKRKKRDRSRSKSKDKERRHRHHHHHHKHKKHKRAREERSKSLSISDLSLSDSDFYIAKKPGSQNEEVRYPEEPVYPLVSLSPQRQEQNVTQPEGGEKEVSLSVEETNRLRAKIGLKPLAVASNVVTEEPSSESTYTAGLEVHKPAENLRDKIQVEKLREKIAAQREKRRLKEKMKRVKTLAEESDDEDATAWVKKSRKFEKERLEADKRNKMLEELDAQFGVGDIIEEEIQQQKKKMYASKNLSGMKVQHDANRFYDGGSTILTLKDSNILDKDEDTLVNVNIMDLEHAEKNVKNRLKKKDEEGNIEDPFDMDESDDVLSKYDTEIEGEKRKSFRIGSRGEGLVPELSNEEKKSQKVAKLRQLTSLETPSYQLATEYMTENDTVSFKKVKKKRKMKMLKADDLLPLGDSHNHLGRRGSQPQSRREENNGDFENGQISEGNTLRSLMEEDEDIVEKMDVEEENEGSESEHDDFELQEAISRSRRAKLANLSKAKTNHISLPVFNSVTEDVKPSINAIDLLKPHNDEEDTENMTLNITDEFCRTLGDIPTYGLSGNRAEEDAIMITSDPSDSKNSWDNQAGAWEEVGIDNSKVDLSDEKCLPILEEEPDTGRGVVNALTLAMKKGYLDKSQSKKTSNAALQHLRAINYSIDDKVVDDDRRGGRGDHGRYNGPTMDFKEKDTYKPDVKLDYVDDEGRKLSAKEAFRYLSHKFHGKGSSKNKLEKRMKKWEEELLMKHMSSSDTPLQTLCRQREKQKSLGVPYLVLSGSKQEVLDVKK